MSIIPVSLLESELPDSAENNNNELTKAVNRATSFVNTWTSKKYDPWDNFTTNDVTLAPDVIVEIAVGVAVLFYRKTSGDVSRDGEDNDLYIESKEDFKTELMDIIVPPKFQTLTIDLDSNDSMVIGSRTTTTGIWTRVLPANSHITSATTNIYVYGEDFTISKGGYNEDEYPEAWYLRAEDSNVEGTLNYMRTFRKDMHDYLVYTK